MLRIFERDDALLETFFECFDFCCADLGLVQTDYQKLPRDATLLNIVRHELDLTKSVIDDFWLSVFEGQAYEAFSELKIEDFEIPVLVSGHVLPPSEMLKNFIVATVASIRSVITYYLAILEPEKACPHFIRNLLKSFGLYEGFLSLPRPIQRKISRLLVHLYKFKGTKYSIRTLMKLLSFAEGNVHELFSYRVGPGYDTDSENLYFEMFYKLLSTGYETQFNVHYRTVIDSRWWIEVIKYSDI